MISVWDAELLEGVLLLLRDVVPAVVAPRLGRGVEDQLGEIEVGQVDAPGGDRLALEDLEGLEPLVAHPVGLSLDLGELLDHLTGDALLGDELSLLVLLDGAGLRDTGLVSGCHTASKLARRTAYQTRQVGVRVA